MANILVTGGSGFIGNRFISAMNGVNHNVFSFDLSDKGIVSERFPRHDILNLNAFEKFILLNKIDVVWHFAAVADLNVMRKDPMKSMLTNIVGTLNIAEVCALRDIKLNFISTCCVYGNQKYHPSSEDHLPNPSEIYACSKMAGEYIVKAYHSSFDLKYNILRIPTTYGPGMRPALGVYIFFEQAMSGKPITIHGEGTQTRTLTYIDDLIDALVLVQEKNIENQTINISTQESVSALDMAFRIKKLTGSESPIVKINQRPGQTFEELIDIGKAVRLLDWTPKISFDEGLRRTYEWLKGQNMQSAKIAAKNTE